MKALSSETTRSARGVSSEHSVPRALELNQIRGVFHDHDGSRQDRPVRLARGYEVPKTSDPDTWTERNPAEGEGGKRQPGRLEDPRRPISRGQIRQAALRAGPRRIRRGGSLWPGNSRAPKGRRNLRDAWHRSWCLCRARY